MGRRREPGGLRLAGLGSGAPEPREGRPHYALWARRLTMRLSGGRPPTQGSGSHLGPALWSGCCVQSLYPGVLGPFILATGLWADTGELSIWVLASGTLDCTSGSHRAGASGLTPGNCQVVPEASRRRREQQRQPERLCTPGSSQSRLDRPPPGLEEGVRPRLHTKRAEGYTASDRGWGKGGRIREEAAVGEQWGE